MKIELGQHSNGTFHLSTSHFIPENICASVVVFPGAGYSFMGPALYYSTNALMDLGFEVLNLEYDFRRIQLENYKDFAAFLEEVTSSFDLHNNRVNLCKSLGSRILASALDHSGKHIWLTPALRDPAVREKLLRLNDRSLTIIGTADPHCDLEFLATLDHKLILKEVDHGLDIDGDVQKSIDIMGEIVSAVTAFSVRG